MAWYSEYQLQKERTKNCHLLQQLWILTSAWLLVPLYLPTGSWVPLSHTLISYIIYPDIFSRYTADLNHFFQREIVAYVEKHFLFLQTSNVTSSSYILHQVQMSSEKKVTNALFALTISPQILTCKITNWWYINRKWNVEHAECCSPQAVWF